ncbi:MAG: NAD(P)/FAD-dependent oxidoreductase [Candidatus Altiarchaeota archaeon]|nr:NAD(P)/FAD-dependent oxidoreductase [Candidatus Altiarchaeota archaeon]
MEERDVIVVGAGISGLLTALALSKEGRDVLILEKACEVGGMCRSYTVEGYQMDTGPHVITRIHGGPLKELMRQYFDVVPNFVPHGRYFVRLNGKVRPFPWNLQGWFTFDLIPQMDRLQLMKTLFSVSYLYNAGEDLSKKSIAELLGSSGLSESTQRFLNCLSYFMTGASMNETPVERFLDSQHYKSRSNNILEKLHNILLKEGALDHVYPKGGLNSITTSILSSIPQKSVSIKTEEEVLRIHPDQKKVETTKGEYAYKTLVYSGFASDLPNISTSLPGDYKKSLSMLPKTVSLTVWLGLKEKVFKRDGSEIWVDSSPHMWVVPISNYDPALAPKGKQLAGFMSRLPENANPEKEGRKALEAIYETKPGIEDKAEMIHYQTLIPEKAAWTINTQFASVKTPLEGIYLVGTDTEKRTMGITRASYSVLKLLGVLREDKVL